MKNSKWIIYYLIIITTIPILAILNYIADPYGLFYRDNFVSHVGKMKLIKAIRIKEVKPKSIILGTSRSEVGFDPNHPYFKQPSKYH